LRDLSERLEQSALQIAEKDRLLGESANKLATQEMKVGVYEEVHNKDTAELKSMLDRIKESKKETRQAQERYIQLQSSTRALEEELAQLKTSSDKARDTSQEKIAVLTQKLQEGLEQMSNQERTIKRLEDEAKKAKDALEVEVEKRKSIEQLDEQRLRLIDLASKDTTRPLDVIQFIKAIPNKSHQAALSRLHTKILPIFAAAKTFRTAVSSTVSKMNDKFEAVYKDTSVSQDEAMNLVAEPIVAGFDELSQIVTGLVAQTGLLPLKILKLFNDIQASTSILTSLETAIAMTAAITQNTTSFSIPPALKRPLMWTLAACMMIASVNTNVPKYTLENRAMVTLSIRYMLVDCVNILQHIQDHYNDLIKDTESSADKNANVALAKKCLALIHAAKNAVQEYRQFESDVFGTDTQPLILQVFQTDSREYELFTQSVAVALQGIESGQ
jgi:hypothetical protein